MEAVTVLMVAEKPSVALSIAGLLSEGRVRHFTVINRAWGLYAISL
jgi:hypothetical protein